MTAEYPKEAQNPPTEPGARPDEQPKPTVRVPDDDRSGTLDGPGERTPSTQESPEAGSPIGRGERSLSD